MALQDFSTEQNAAVDNDFYTGVGLVVQAVLQDPEFLYRIEVGQPTTDDGVFKLDDYEIATRMAYLLWGSTPSDELLQDAEDGKLEATQDRLDVVERMLDDPRARTQMHRYHAMWLGYRGIPHSADLVEAFSEETSALIDRVIFDDHLNYTELFTLNETFVDDALAQHYGLPSPNGGRGWVTYDSTERSGILGHGSVLAAFSKFTDTSPTQRGIFVRERLMCLETPAPPPEVDPDNPPGNPDDPTACKEERYDAHREIQSCASCHNLFDPIGIGLEKYDIAGVYRDHDDGKPECIIAAAGELPGVGSFSGPAELAQRLIESELLESCAVQQYLTFAYGRELESEEKERIETMLGALRGWTVRLCPTRGRLRGGTSCSGSEERPSNRGDDDGISTQS